MIQKEFLENIEWFIANKPNLNSLVFRNNKQSLNEDDLNKIVLDFNSNIELSFPLDDNYDVFKNIEISGKQTLKSLLKQIYNFYQTNIEIDLVDKIFKETPEFYNELIENLEEGESLKYIDAFSGSVCPPDFVGLSRAKSKKIIFRVELGPL
jgi:hypothetical protein